MVSVPAPLILAPALFKKSAKSTISGSFAAPLMVVVPFDKTEDKRKYLSKEEFVDIAKIFCIEQDDEKVEVWYEAYNDN